jgi:hypothetical protein
MEYSPHLTENPDQQPYVKAIIRDGEKRGNKGRTVKLKLGNKYFVETHGCAGAA